MAQAAALVEETGGDVGSTIYATFKRFHHKDVEYVDTKSRRIGKEVERRYTLACQPLSDGTLPPLVGINHIYKEVCGNLNKKNHIFGIGSPYTSHASSPTCPLNIFLSGTSSQLHQHEQHQHEQLRAQLEAEHLEMEARMEARLEARLKDMEDKYCQDRDYLKAQIDAMKEFMS